MSVHVYTRLYLKKISQHSLETNEIANSTIKSGLLRRNKAVDLDHCIRVDYRIFQQRCKMRITFSFRSQPV